jgi:hypothetical protein
MEFAMKSASTVGEVLPSPLPPPPPDLRPERLTWGAVWGALVATVMTMPGFVVSLSWSGNPGDPGPSGWPVVLWGVAFFAGVASMILAVTTRGRERRRGSRQGRTLGTIAVCIASLGALLWSYLFLLSMNASL